MNIKDGKYYDGLGPVSKPVICIITAAGLLIIHAETEIPVAIWVREDIFLDENHNTAMVLGNKKDKSKIELTNLNIAKALGLNHEGLIKTEASLIFKWLGIICVSVAVFWLSIPFVTKMIAKKIPYSVELSVAEKMGIESRFQVCKQTPRETEAMNYFIALVYPKNELEKAMPIKMNVVKMHAVNAYTFPGGKIVLSNNLINEAKSPEELLGVMSHEIGHVVGRDSVNFLVRGTLLASFFGYLTGDFNSAFAMSPQLLLSTAALTFDRDMERKADAFAAERLISANLTTSGLKSFFSRKLYDGSPLSMPEMFMTHPSDENRIKLIKEFYPKGNHSKELVENWKIIKELSFNCKV